MASTDYRAASHDQWQRSAEGWRRHADDVDRIAEPVTRWMIEAAALQPGGKVLELACGPAGVGIAAARAVGPEGVVICSDFAEPMLDLARERVAAAGLANVELRLIDGERIDLFDSEVDAVLCRFGFMLMADPGRALQESFRVLRPGGRIALAVWDEAARNPWLAVPFGVVMSHFSAPPPEPGAPGVFALADEGRLRGLLEDAGFADVRFERVAVPRGFDSFEAWWTETQEMAAPLRDLLGRASKDDRTALEGRLREAVAPFTDGQGAIEFPTSALVAAARRA
jgi:SAM-dependent methyltransferase